MHLLKFLVLVLILSSCTNGNNTNEDTENDVPARSELSMDSKIFLGNRLFSEKTCITCHSLYKKKIGPSVVDIMETYQAKNASIEVFLRGGTKAIVDTTASQVSIMQENIDGFLQNVTDEELNAIATYMLHVSESHSK